MATPSYAETIRYAGEVKSLTDAATKAITKAIKGKLGNELIDAALRVIESYGVQGKELGAQWYDFCASKAGVPADAASIEPMDLQGYQFALEDLVSSFDLDEIDAEEMYRRITEMVGDVAANTSRDAVYENMVRDQFLDWRLDPNDRRVRYARIPVGETCAWCIMLASLGAWYLSYESAGGLDPDHFHAHCDCVVVPYATPDDIPGYASSLGRYRDMYYTANSDRSHGELSPELQERISMARAKHEEKYAAGETDKRWTNYNETLIVMRDYYDLH